MKYIISILVLGLFFVGCNKLEGQLNVTSELKLKNSKGDNHILRLGTYTADLDKKTLSKKIVLRLNNDNDEKFEFKIPDGTTIPSNGTFKLKSSDIGQPVDLQADIKTVITESQVREEFQSCSYTEPYTVCSPSGPNGQTICNTYSRTVNGSQWVRYYDRYLNQNIHLLINQANQETSSADFNGDLSNVQRIVVNQTQCR